jgi:hypothetical protein
MVQLRRLSSVPRYLVERARGGGVVAGWLPLNRVREDIGVTVLTVEVTRIGWRGTRMEYATYGAV